ncbi:anhydro-N-acetylmuramic acid kinase [Agromyces sp. H66]|uniref:anhydro-N-acetylmuramic acid kinase n=1 Tax=Agromyces sp. H66 TaxID=2529859 RepID=UPI0010AB3B6C|nr:anhydro-N-acetylmuramic acid kinase [Agromyces sp. H66]
MIVSSLQSGTSADGIDVAVVEFTLDPVVGEPRSGDSRPSARPAAGLRVRHTATLDWEPELRARILAASAGETLSAGAFCELDTRLGQAFASAAAAGVDATAVTPDLVVSHGQTLFHWVEGGRARGTLQLGEPAWIADRVGAPVLSHLRAADIAAGGEGAPLMALFDRLWLGAEAAAADRAIATVNLGGIANVQVVRPSGEVIAFDSGPGNALLDAVVARATGGEAGCDEGGRLAATGHVDRRLLDELLGHPYFAAPVPKTTGRETFDLGVVDRALDAVGSGDGSIAASPLATPPLEDLCATLTELTARTVVNAIPATDAPTDLIVSGGGALNPVLLARLGALAADRGIRVESSDARGIDPAFKESLMFALVGVLSWHGVPVRLSAAGSGEPRVAGRFTPGRMPLQLPPPLAGVASVTVTTSTATDLGGTPR